MPSLSRSQIIVLHLTKYGESGIILHTLDSVSGRRSLYLQGVGRRSNASATAHFHSLSILDVITYTSSKSSLSYLKEYSPSVTLDSIRTDIYKSTISLFISEVLYRCLKEENGDQALFNWLCEAITALNEMKESCANFHLWFLTGFCSKMGFCPKDNYGGDNLLFDAVSASYIPAFASSDIVFSSENSEILHIMLSSSFEKAMQLKLSGSLRSDFASNMLKYLSYHLGSEINIKSLSVMHQIFC